MFFKDICHLVDFELRRRRYISISSYSPFIYLQQIMTLFFVHILLWILN